MSMMKWEIGEFIPTDTMQTWKPIPLVRSEMKEIGKEFQLGLHQGDSTPYIKSKLTGKLFHLSWGDIVEIAIVQGILLPN